MASPYSSREDLAIPLSAGYEEKLIELDGESDDVNTAPHQQPGEKAPRPKKASRAFRHAQLTVHKFIRRRCRAVTAQRRGEDDDCLPLSAIELILARLDIRGAAGGIDGQDYDGARAPARPCPSSAEELYDRLVYSRDVARRQESLPTLARRLLGSCGPTAQRHGQPSPCVARDELPRLLGPVAAEMRACLGYVAAFRSLLDLETEGCDHWLDLSQLRACVFRLTGYWPHDVSHDLEAWAFGLPEDLARLLYPQGGRFDHREMAANLDEGVIGPGWEGLVKLEGIIQPHQRYFS